MTTFVDNTTLITAAFLNACATVVEAAGPIALATVTPAADTIAYYTGASAAASTALSSFARTLIDDASAAAARTTLGLGTAAVTAVGDYATAAQGAKADTAVQPANPAFTGTATFNTTYAAFRSTGNVSIGWNGEPVYTASANRTYLTLKGQGTGSTEGNAVIQFLSNATDADSNTLGIIDWADVNNTSGNKRVAAIQAIMSGTTANNRGARLVFSTRADGAASTTERMRIDRDGNIGIKTTTTGSGDQLRFGDGSDYAWARIYASGTADLNPLLKLSRQGYSDWVIGVGGSARDNFNISYAPAADTEAALATARVVTIDNTKNVGIGAIPNTAKLLVNCNAGTPQTPTSSCIWATGVDAAPAVIGADAFAGVAKIILRRANTTSAAPTLISADDQIGAIEARGYSSGGPGYLTGGYATLGMFAAEAWSAVGRAGTYLTLSTTAMLTTTLSERVRVYDTGKVAITTVNSTISATNQAHLIVGAGTSAPTALSSACALQVIAADGASSRISADSIANSSIYIGRRGNGTAAALTALAANDLILSFQARGYYVTGGPSYSVSQAAFQCYAGEAWTSTNLGTYLAFLTTANGSTTLTEQMRIAGDGAITITNKIASYNGVATVANGVAAMVAKSFLTAQSAAIGATTLYAVPAAGQGMYRVSWVASITTAATTSSGLGGLATTGFKVIFTDPTDSVVKTSAPNSQNNSTSTTTNVTTTTVSGTFNTFCKASTNLQYSFDYASVNAAEMVYDLSIIVEYLGA